MNSNQLLDAVKTKLNLPSDYALSDALGMSRQGVRVLRENGLSDARAVQIATILGLNPGKALAWVHAERARDPLVKKIWEKVAKSLIASLIVAGLWAIPSPQAAAAEILAQSNNQLYIMRRWLLGLLRRFLGTCRYHWKVKTGQWPALHPLDPLNFQRPDGTRDLDAEEAAWREHEND